MDVAFRNPDGSTALVVHNENDDPRTFAVSVGGRSFDYTLPGGALATFTWPRSRQLDDGYDLLPLRGATATAVPTGETPQGAVDDDASTRWSTDAAQTPGQQLQVDLGHRETFRRVVLDTGASTGDFPRSWTLQVSNDASGWRTLASGTGTGQLTTIDVPRTHARYLRVLSTGSADSWWSVADLRLYD
jgi:glucosylceramidase